MNQQQKEALEKCLVYLCKNLDITEVLVFLRSRGTLTPVQCQHILKQGSTEYERNYALIQALKRKSYQTFDLFLESLLLSNQTSLADKIIESLHDLNEQEDNAETVVQQTSILTTNEQSREENLTWKADRFPAASTLTASVTAQIPGFRITNNFSPMNPFCILPDGQSALILAPASELDGRDHDPSYVQINFSNGEKTVFETEQPRTQRKSCVFIHTVVRGSHTFILSGMNDWDTGQCFLVSQYFSERGVLLVHERDTSVCGRGPDSLVCIQENAAGDMFVFIRLCATGRDKTIFHAVKILLDDNGKIQSKVVVENCLLEGGWWAPILHLNELYWLPRDEIHAGELLNVKFDGVSDSSGTVNVVTKRLPVIVPDDLYIGYEILRGGNQIPAVIGDSVFFYSYSDNHIGQLLHLDLIRKCWQILSLNMRGGEVVSHGAGIRAVPDIGYLYLNGNQEKSEDRSEEGWIYCIKIDGLQLVTTTSGLKKEQQKEQLNFTSHELNIQKPATEKWTPSETYEKQEKLGSGAFGVAYKCWDSVSQQYFVAKYTHIVTDQNIEIARNEVKHLQNCSHAKVVSYFGFKVENENVIIFMEYMPGGSLFHFIENNGPIAEETAVNYISQILEGLIHIHGLGIVHNDIKCANLFLDGKGNVKIGDFGIAVQKRLNTMDRSYGQSTAKGRGTLHWSAPEILKQCEDCFSRRADIWSLGCTIVEMLTGQPPHSQIINLEYAQKLYRNLLSYDPDTITPEASDKMKAYLSLLLQIDINKRPHTGEVARERFHEIFVCKSI